MGSKLEPSSHTPRLAGWFSFLLLSLIQVFTLSTDFYRGTEQKLEKEEERRRERENVEVKNIYIFLQIRADRREEMYSNRYIYDGVMLYPKNWPGCHEVYTSILLAMWLFFFPHSHTCIHWWRRLPWKMPARHSSEWINILLKDPGIEPPSFWWVGNKVYCVNHSPLSLNLQATL